MKTELTTKKIAYSGLFAALTALGVFIRIPMPLIPFSLQTLFVFMAGALLGPVPGFFSQLVYVLSGLAGLLVFTHGGGLGYVTVPTFGYLSGYPIGAYLIGKFSQNVDITEVPEYKALLKLAMAIWLGSLVIFMFGVIYLYFCSRYLLQTQITLPFTLWSGFVIFIPVNLLKIFIAAFFTIRIKKSGVLSL